MRPKVLKFEEMGLWYARVVSALGLQHDRLDLTIFVHELGHLALPSGEGGGRRRSAASASAAAAGAAAAAASASMSLLASPLQLNVPVPNSVTPITAPPSTQPQEPSPITVALAQIDQIRPLVMKEINLRYADADSKERSKKFRKVMRTVSQHSNEEFVQAHVQSAATKTDVALVAEQMTTIHNQYVADKDQHVDPEDEILSQG